MIGRLKPGVSESRARDDVQVLSSRIEQDYPETDKGRSAILTATTTIPAGDREDASLLLGTLIIVVVHTCRTMDSIDIIRIISARRAAPQERKLYVKTI